MDSHDELLRRLDENAARTQAELAALRAEFVASEERTRTDAMETRRHMDIVGESLRADIRLLAEPLLDMVPRSEFEQFRSEIREDFVSVRSLIRGSHTDLDRRVGRLETPSGG